MRWMAYLIFALLSVACGGSVESGQDQGSGSRGAGNGSGSGGGAQQAPSGAYSLELVASDPLRSTYDFERVDYGHVIQNGAIVNAGSQIDYSGYYPSELTVGIQGSDVGIIVDLGLDAEVAERIGVAETVGGGQGFAALSLTDSGFNDPAAAPVLSAAVQDLSMQSTGHVRPKLGHVLAFRIVRDDKVDLIVKLLIVSVIDAERVSMLWSRLE